VGGSDIAAQARIRKFVHARDRAQSAWQRAQTAAQRADALRLAADAELALHSPLASWGRVQ